MHASLSELRHSQDIVSMKIFPALLSKDVHWYAQKTDCNFNAAEYDEQRPYADREDPIVGIVGQYEGEEVLEDDEVCECFDRDVSVGVQEILGRCYRSTNHAYNDESEEDLWNNPTIA